MKSKGFVLIVCLCFIALVSSMALSGLLIGLLSQKIGVAGQLQLQQLQRAKQLHLQQLGPQNNLVAQGESAVCPAELATWSTPVTRCRWIVVSSQHEQLTGWSSLMLATELQIPQEAL